ncbi:MAG: protein translocase subunit SecF [Proteobacteria bacterium]|nr:protein translocase subunit SecF [Pseudomonadota bacterium]
MLSREKKYNVNFVGYRKTAAICSFFLVLLSLSLFIFRGPTWGIDFTGGTEIQISFDQKTDIAEVRAAMQKQGLSDDAVQQVGGADESGFVIRVQDPMFGSDGLKEDITSKLDGAFGTGWVEEASFDNQVGARMVVRHSGDAKSASDLEAPLSSIEGLKVEQAPDDNTFYIKLPSISSKIEDALKENIKSSFDVLQTDSVGPKVGDELKEQGIVSILSTLGLILLYVAFRFNLAYAPGAVLALFHDVVVVVGIFIFLDILGWTHEFNLPMVGALLTIIGYSLNDTIVIYDRIRENTASYRQSKLPELINNSINETLRRTIATSITTMLAMLAFLFLGGPVIQTFALAIFLGVIFGTYSTVFVASPTILLMEELRPKIEAVLAPIASEKEEEQQPDIVLSKAEQRRRMEAELESELAP